MEKKLLKIEYYFEWVFKVGLLVYALLSFNSLCYGKSIISLVLWPVILLGGILLLIKLRYWKEWIRTPSIILLGLFLVSYIISMVVNIEYGYKEGIIKLVFLVFYFFILYTKRNGTTKEYIEREIKVLGGILSLYKHV